MANWALVIGVDKYWTKEACLRGAVRDALNIRQWLIDSGSVPAANITLLLGPDQNPVPAGVTAAIPTQDEIINAAAAIVANSGGVGDRFFFHFSGHGLSTERDFSLVEAILCSDVTARNPTRSLSVRSITEYFAATQFAEQLFFIDACRNVPWDGQFRVGDMPWQPRRDVTKPPVQQFVMFAASPGVKAAEMTEAGNEQGAFTESLLKGLRGEGKAKAWDIREGEYVVRFDRLLQFVIDDVQEKRKNVGAPGRRLWQLPRRTGEQGSATGSNPVLAHFDEGDFSELPLKVAIDPFVAKAKPKLNLYGAGKSKEQSGFSTVPVEIKLPPDEYRVRCSANGYLEAEKKGLYVELWEPSPAPVTVKLTADPNYEEGREALVVEVTRGLDEAGPAAQGSITIRSQDELAPLELYDSGGVLLESAAGYLHEVDLPAGRYRAVLRMPGVEPVAEIIDLDAGEHEERTVNAPAPSVPGLPLHNVLPDNTVIISETSGVGPVAAPMLSTILALAGGASLVDRSQLEAYHLRELGVQMFNAKMPDEQSGTMVLVAEENEDATLVQAKVRMWRMGERPGDARELLRIREQIAEYAQPAAPGSYWVAVETANVRPLVFASAVVRSRMHMIVLARGRDGILQVFEYLPHTQGTYEHPQQLRRLEMQQRHYAAGSLRHASELVNLKFEDPIGGCLGGFMYLRLNEPRKLEIVVHNMTSYFGELSDSWVLKGEYETSRGNTHSAEAAYREALERGVPLMLDGVSRLRDGALRYHIEHPRLELLKTLWDRRMRDAIWTTWIADELPA